MNLLVHGVYDVQTLQTILDLGIHNIGFDLRGKSPNLIPFTQLTALLSKLSGRDVHLVFEDDKETTVLSFLNLLKDQKATLVLEFRDAKSAEYYQSINHPFSWMFNPEAPWKEILKSEKIKSILLPLKWQETYKKLPELWDIIERRHLKVYLHVSHVSELHSLLPQRGVVCSVDLGREVESGFRKVDQEKLKKFLGRRSDENFAGQR